MTSMTYTPIHSDLPCLQVPENRVRCAYLNYEGCRDHPNIFAAYSYWIQLCENDGTDY
jgi:hypothetical protein